MQQYVKFTNFQVKFTKSPHADIYYAQIPCPAMLKETLCPVWPNHVPEHRCMRGKHFQRI